MSLKSRWISLLTKKEETNMFSHVSEQEQYLVGHEIKYKTKREAADENLFI